MEVIEEHLAQFAKNGLVIQTRQRRCMDATLVVLVLVASDFFWDINLIKKEDYS